MPLWIIDLYVFVLESKYTTLYMIIDKNDALYLNKFTRDGDRFVQEFINDLQKE